MTLSTFQDLLAELFKADEKCRIYPWKDSDISRRIKNSKDISSTDECKLFLNRMYIPKEYQAGQIYSNIRIGHDTPIEEIRKDMNEFFKEKNTD